MSVPKIKSAVGLLIAAGAIWAGPHLTAAPPGKTEKEDDRWAKSGDGVIGVRLRARFDPVEVDNPIILIATVRNFSDEPVTVPRGLVLIVPGAVGRRCFGDLDNPTNVSFDGTLPPYMPGWRVWCAVPLLQARFRQLPFLPISIPYRK